MKTLRLLPVLALFAICGCTDTVQPQMDEIPLFARNSAAKVEVAFTMEVSGAGGAYIKDLGQSGRVMVRDYELFFDVAGYLEGTAEMVLNANFDEASWLGTGLGRASVFGDLSILTGAGTWEGLPGALQVETREEGARIDLQGVCKLLFLQCFLEQPDIALEHARIQPHLTLSPGLYHPFSEGFPKTVKDLVQGIPGPGFIGLGPELGQESFSSQESSSPLESQIGQDRHPFGLDKELLKLLI